MSRAADDSASSSTTTTTTTTTTSTTQPPTPSVAVAAWPLCGVCAAPVSAAPPPPPACELCHAPQHAHCARTTSTSTAPAFSSNSLVALAAVAPQHQHVCACVRVLRISDVIADRLSAEASSVFSTTSTTSSSSSSALWQLLSREARAALRRAASPPPSDETAHLEKRVFSSDELAEVATAASSARVSERLVKRRRVADARFHAQRLRCGGLFELSYAAASLASPVHANQDCYLAPAVAAGDERAVRSALPLFPAALPLFAVFDGHGAGGERVSRLAADTFAHELAALARAASVAAHHEHGADAVPLVQLLLSEAVAGTNAALMAAAGDDAIALERGSTLCAAVVVGAQLVHAHVGDSRLMLLRGQRLVALTADHSAKRADERARIRAAGGTVTLDGREHRLQKRIAGADGGVVTATLGMTRGLGHVHFARVGVTALPDIGAVELRVGDRLLVATDGVTDVLSSEALRRTLANAESAADAAQLLCDAVAAGRDDRTLIVITVDALDTTTAAAAATTTDA